jgi:hypothetical protein
MGHLWTGAGHARRALAVALLAAMLLPAAWAAQAAWRQIDGVVDRHAGFRDALLTRGAETAVLADPQVPDWYLRGLVDLRPAAGRADPPPTVLADELELDFLPPTVRQVLRLDPVDGRLVDVAADLPAQLAAWRARLRSAPMQVSIEREVDRGEVRWRFAAAEPGRFVLLAPGQRLDVPSAEGALRLAQRLPECLRIRFDAVAGWSSYSPPLAWSAADRQGISRLQWQGRGDAFAPGTTAWCSASARAAAS